MAKLSLFERRRRRVRTALKKRGGARPRLSVHRTGRHIYAQIIDDEGGRTLVAASTLSKALPRSADHMKKTEAAKAVGLLVAERALAASIQSVVFDRGGYPYHGRVKALAAGAREKGLQF